MPASELLERKILNYARKLNRERCISVFASGAEFQSCKQVAKSGDHVKSDIVNCLKLKLSTYGVIGAKIGTTSLGFCAEVVAYNRVLKFTGYRCCGIKVGKAIRIKTLQEGKKCKICRKMFL